MKKFKGLIILLIILGIYGLVLFFTFGNKDNNSSGNTNNNTVNNKTDNKTEYLVIGNTSNLKYNNGVFTKSGKYEIERLDSLKVYVNNKYYGDYKLKSGENWNLFDNKDEFVNYNGSLIAFSNTFNVKVRSNYKVREINEKDKVFLINDYNISSFSNLTTNEVIDIDLDNNGVNDEIICISSLDDSIDVKNYFSLVIIVLNEERITLIEEKEDKAIHIYSVYGVLNIDNNDHDSIILTQTEGYISEKPIVSNLIYNYKNDKYMID